ncbi:MAG: hypothetical protein KBG75_00685 [Pseudomonadales bacterium]|nr:hypothetical protein [Pseudomonadales bacterium]
MNAAGQAGNTRWRFFALLAAMAFLSYALRQDIQVAGQFMMPALGISEVQMGWIYAAFPLGYAVAQLPGGMLGEGGWLAALPWLTGTFAAVLGGWACDRLCGRFGPRLGCRIPGACGMAATTVFLLAGLRVDNAYLAVALLSLCFASTQFTEAAFWEAQIFIAPAHAGPGTGIMNTAASIAGIIVSPLVPWLAVMQGWGWVPALAGAAGFGLLSALLCLFVRADRPLPAHGA